MRRVPFGWAVFFCIGFFFMGFANPIFFAVALIDFVFMIPSLVSIRKDVSKHRSEKEVQKTKQRQHKKFTKDIKAAQKAFVNLYGSSDKEKYEAAVCLWGIFSDDNNEYVAKYILDIMGNSMTSGKMRVFLKKYVLALSETVSEEYVKPVDQLLMEINKKVGSV